MDAKKHLLWLTVLVAVVLLWLLLPGIRRPSQFQAQTKQGQTRPASASGAPRSETVAPQAFTEETSPSGTNAADLYKGAFVLWRQLSDEDKKLLKERAKIDPATAPAVFEKIKPILELLREAARAEYCDWAMEEPTFEKPLPQMQLVMDLGRVAAWAAAYLFKQDPDAACQVLADHQSLGDSVGNYCLIGSLVQKSLESVADNVLRDNFASLTPALAEKYKALFAPSAVGTDFPEAFQAESALMRKIADIPQFAELQKQRPISAGQMEQILKQYEQGSKMMQASDEEFSQWNSQLQNLAKGAAMEGVVPAWEGVRSSLQKRVIERQMLGAALAFRGSASGQPMVGDQSFIFRQTPNGFELESRARFDGKPVVLSFPSSK